MSFLMAGSVDEAVQALADGARPVAGGTDLVVGARQGKLPLPESLVAIDRLEELANIESTEDGTRIGALVTHARLMADPIVVQSYTALADAAALVGSPSTRNVGTLGGNVMNASPAMDTGAPLIVFGATAELRSTSGSRRVRVTDLWTGPGNTSAAPDELCVALHLSTPRPRSGSAYVRLEYRRAMEIAIVGAGASVTLHEDGTIAHAAVALTAVAPTIVEVAGAAELLEGMSLEEAGAAIAVAASTTAAPISDLRAGHQYRRHTVGVMARRAVEAAARRAAGQLISVPVNRTLGIGAAR